MTFDLLPFNIDFKLEFGAVKTTIYNRYIKQICKMFTLFRIYVGTEAQNAYKMEIYPKYVNTYL